MDTHTTQTMLQEEKPLSSKSKKIFNYYLDEDNDSGEGWEKILKELKAEKEIKKQT